MQVVLIGLGIVADVQATALRATRGRIKLAEIHRRTLGRMQEFASAGLVFRSGAVGAVIATTASYPGRSEQIVLNCTKGTAVLNATTLSIYHRSGEVEKFGEAVATGGGADPMAFTHERHQAIVEGFADSPGNGTDPFVTGRAALHVHAMIDAIQMSSAEGRIVDVDKDIVNV